MTNHVFYFLNVIEDSVHDLVFYFLNATQIFLGVYF